MSILKRDINPFILAIITLTILMAAIMAMSFCVGLTTYPEPSPEPTPAPISSPHAIFSANSTGVQAVLTEYTAARNVTFEQLKSFLESDHTEDHEYVAPTYTCSDFAKELHDNAEASGIACGYVSVVYEDASRHAVVVFNTTNKGPIYIDETYGYDAKVRLQHWEPYEHTKLDSEQYARSIGDIVDDVYIYW